VNVVAGGTYISGGNIWTGSVQADRIVSYSITSTQVNAELFATTATRPETNARRVAAVYGNWTAGSLNSQLMNWDSITIRYGDARSQTITNGGFAFTGSPYSGWTYAYLYVDLSNTAANQGFGVTNDLLQLTSNRQAIAVLRRSSISGYVSVTVLAGITYISGDSIVTGSIVADNIAADAVTAEKINVTSLAAVSTNTGSLSVTGGITVGSAGNIHTFGKDGLGNVTPGFFLGHNGSAYVFDIGDQNNFLRWNGANLSFQTETPIGLTA